MPSITLTLDFPPVAGHFRSVIHSEWEAVCDLAAMTQADRNRLWGRQFLNPYALYGY